MRLLTRDQITRRGGTKEAFHLTVRIPQSHCAAEG
jgi:hypothetical protein